MVSLRFHSQVTAPDGSINQEGVDRLIRGADNWNVFFREVFQNSNDARLDSGKSIGFSVDLSELSSEALGAVLASMEDNEEVSNQLGLANLGGDEEVKMLVVADSDTSGLSGGTNPQTAVDNSRFTQFFFDLGQRASTGQKSGGSFGFGRNVFFQASKVKTIFVFTRFKDELGMLRPRFMGMAAFKSLTVEGHRLTGRHWWGAPGDLTSVITPFEGEEAEKLGSIFGLSQYLEGKTGTAVGILAPHDADSSLLRKLQASALLYAWPHMAPLSAQSDEPSVRFSFSVEGMQLREIKPYDADSPIQGFYHAYLALQQAGQRIGSDIEVATLDSATREKYSLGRGRLCTGRLHSFNIPNGQSAKWALSDEIRDLEFEETHQVALMRGPKIIVKYIPVYPDLADFVTSGVFVSSESFDTVFRDSENITHDVWDPDRLELSRGLANPVKVTLDKIKGIFAPRLESASSSQPGAADIALADFVGRFISGVEATGGSGKSGGGSSGGGGGTGLKPSAVIRNVRFVKTNTAAGVAEGAFDVLLRWPDRAPSHARALQISSKIQAADGAEKSAPLGSKEPVLLQVSSERKNYPVSLDGSVYLAEGDRPQKLSCRIEYPLESRISVSVNFRDGDPE